MPKKIEKTPEVTSELEKLLRKAMESGYINPMAPKPVKVPDMAPELELKPCRVTMPNRVQITGVGNLRSFDAVYNPLTGVITSTNLPVNVTFHIAAGVFLTPR